MRDNKIDKKRQAMRADQIDEMDEPRLMDEITLDFEQRESEVLPFEPDAELRDIGDPGRGMVDHPDEEDGWVEPGPNPEEDGIFEFDDLVSDIDENWEDELLDL